MLEAKTVVVQAEPENFAENHERQHIQKQCQAVVLKCGSVGKISEGAAPSRKEQGRHQGQTEKKIGNAQPPPDAVIVPRFRRIGRDGNGSGCRHHCFLPDYRIGENELRVAEGQ